MNNVHVSADKAPDGLFPDRRLVLRGGSGLCGISEPLIDANFKVGVNDLTIATKNCDVDRLEIRAATGGTSI